MGSDLSENNCTWLCHTMSVHFCNILVTQWLIFLTLLWHNGLLFLTSCAHICDTGWHFRDTVRSLLIPRSSILADIDTPWVKEAGFAHRRFPILFLRYILLFLCFVILHLCGIDTLNTGEEDCQSTKTSGSSKPHSDIISPFEICVIFTARLQP